MASVDEALKSSQSFVRSLKASTDPPHENGPTKIQIARSAWDSRTLYVPHKAGLILEWIFNRFHKDKSKTGDENALLDYNYWSLFADILIEPSDAQIDALILRASIPSLLASFITLYPSIPLSSRPTILGHLLRSLNIAWPLVLQRTSLDGWAECLWSSFTVTNRLNNDLISGEFVDVLVLVVTGFRAAFEKANTAGRKKVYNTISQQHQLLPWLRSLHSVASVHSLHGHIYAAGVEILFNPDALRTFLERHHNSKADHDFFATLFNAITPSDSAALASLLKLLPDLYRAYIIALNKHRTSIFSGICTIQHSPDRIRDAALRFEDESLVFLNGISNPDTQEALWKATVDVLRVTEEEGIFNSAQEDDHASRLRQVGEDAVRKLDLAWDAPQPLLLLTHALDTLSCLHRIEPTLVLELHSQILEHLAIYSPPLHPPVLTFLGQLMSYYAKTRTLHTYVSLLLSGLMSSSPPGILGPQAKHQLYTHSPLLSLPFMEELSNTLRTFLTPGQADGVVALVTEALKSCAAPLTRQSSQEHTRKRRKLTAEDTEQTSPASNSNDNWLDVIKFALITQLGTTILGAILYNNTNKETLERKRVCLASMDTWISDELQFVFPLDDGKSNPKSHDRKKRSRPTTVIELEWTQECFLSAILRVWYGLFAARSGSWRGMEMENNWIAPATLYRLNDLFQRYMRKDMLPELHLEIGRVLYASKETPYATMAQLDGTTWPGLDAVLDYVEENLFSDSASLTNANARSIRQYSALTLFGVTLERHLPTIDTHASKVQLDRLVDLMLRTQPEMQPPQQDESPYTASILARAFDSASFWECSNLRRSMVSVLDKNTSILGSVDTQDLLSTITSGDFKSINTPHKLGKLCLADVDASMKVYLLLHHFPPEYLPKSLRSELVTRAFNADILVRAFSPTDEPHSGSHVEWRAILRSFIVMIAKQAQIRYLEDMASSPEWIKYLILSRYGPARPTKEYTRATLDLLNMIQNSAARSVIKTRGASLANLITHFVECNPYPNGDLVGEPLAHRSLLQFANMLGRDLNIFSFEESVLSLLRQLCINLEKTLRPAVSAVANQTQTRFLASELVVEAWQVHLSLKGWLAMDLSMETLGETLLQRTARIITTSSEAQTISKEFRVIIMNLLIAQGQARPEADCRHVATMIAAYVLFTTSTNHHDTIYDISMGRATKQLSVTQYQRALELVAEALQDGPDAEPQLMALIHLSTLLLREAPERTSKVSHKHASQCLRAFINRPVFVNCSSALATRILDFVQFQCIERPASLRPLDAAWMLSYFSKLLAACSEHDERTSSSIFQGIVNVVDALIRLRRDLLMPYLPHLSVVLRQLISAIRGIRSSLGSKQHRIVADKLPKWINSSEPLGEAESRVLARLLTSITTKSLVRTHRSDPQKAASLARPFIRHAPYVLLAYLQLLNDPLSVLSGSVRRELKPGLYALCSMMGEHGRDTLMAQSLDVGGKVLLKSLWIEYDKQRYTGGG